MNYKSIVLVIFSFISNTAFAQTSLTFNSLDSLLAYAEKNSISIKTGEQQSILAKWTKTAALANTVNIKSPVSFAMTDNTKLPVNFIPGEAFGGPAGSLKQITLGQQYISNLSITPQIDIINPSTWARVNSAELNREMTELSNLLTKRNLFESVAANYYNIISISQQIAITQQNLNTSDSIRIVFKNKLEKGIIREQEYNNAEANYLTVADKLNLLNYSLTQQQQSLKILCDFPESTVLTLSEKLPESVPNQLTTANSTLTEKYAQTQSLYMQSEYKASKMWYYPTLSLVGNQSWQQNSNAKFFDSNANWIASQYIGLRLTVPLPVEATRISQTYTAKINLRISELNRQHSAQQNKLNNSLLNEEFTSAVSSVTYQNKIAELKKSNYEKSKNQYEQGILSTDLLLQSLTEHLSANLNKVSALSKVYFIQSKININNSVQ